MGKINTAMCSFLSNKERFADLFNGALNHCLHNPAEWLSGITKNDRLAPVYTLCLYHGEEPWDGPHSLRDMIHFGNNSDNLNHFFADYPMRLFCVNEHSVFSCFHAELQEVFTALAFRKSKKKLYTAMTENATFYRLSSETIKVISILLNTPRLWTERNKFMSVNQNDKEEYDMCQAMQELYEDWRNEGIDLMSLLVQKLFTDNRVEDLKKAALNPEFRDNLLKEYSLKA